MGSYLLVQKETWSSLSSVMSYNEERGEENDEISTLEENNCADVLPKKNEIRFL